MNTSIIPEQFTGKKNDISVEKSFSTHTATLPVFTRACDRLLRPNIWHLLAGDAKAGFTLFDHFGNTPDRLLQAGDYIRIDIPGPGSKEGNGYDWVAVKTIDDHRQLSNTSAELGILMVVCPNPFHSSTDAAHFFSSPASSSIIVTMKDDLVSTSYHGRNESINNNTNSVADNIRNTVVGLGAFIGLSEIQWKALLEGLLKD